MTGATLCLLGGGGGCKCTYQVLMTFEADANLRGLHAGWSCAVQGEGDDGEGQMVLGLG